MRSLVLTRSFYRSPQNGLIFLLGVVLFCEIIGWATSPETKWYVYSSYQTLFDYLKNLFLGIVAPELFTLYILVFLIDIFHRFMGIRQVNTNFFSLIKYEAKFLPLFLIAFFLFFPITLHVRFLLREFPNYSFNRYLDLYIFNGFTFQTYFLYLPFVTLLGYILINVSLVKDFLESNASLKSISNNVSFLKSETETTPAPTKVEIATSKALPKMEKVELVAPPRSENYLRLIEAKTSTGELYLKVEECYFFETIEERYYVEHPKGRFRITKSLTILEEELDPLHFFRGHRSFIVNLSLLDSYLYWEKGKYILYIKTPTEVRELVMSRNRFNTFRDAFTANRMRL